MALKKRVYASYLFPNGNLGTFDFEGKQIPELQGTYSIETHKRILLEAMDTSNLYGFGILPQEFIKTVNEYANYFRSQNLSWEEIKAL